MKLNTLSAVLFTTFVIAYLAVRAHWAAKAEKRPVQEKKSFFLDKLNIALVGLFALVLPLVAVLSPWLERFDYPAHASQVLLSVPFLIGGLTVFWLSHRDLGENWSVTLELKENHSLVTNGIYRTIRHPMYLSIWLVAIGQALCVPNLVGGIGGLFAWALLYFVRIGKEETMMLEKFGEEYRAYMQRTRRLY